MQSSRVSAFALMGIFTALVASGCGGFHAQLDRDRESISAQDRAEIHALIALYAHAFDGRDIDAWVDLFTEDAEIVTSVVGSPKGKDALRSWAEERLKNRSDRQVRHFSTNLLVIPISRDLVRARSYVLVTEQKLTEQARAQVLYSGVYADEIRRTERGWKFSRRRAEVALPLDDQLRCASGC